MKLKEAKLCCAFSWSPVSAAAGLMIATGSVAGAMDDDFNSEAFLEIRKVDMNDTTNGMPIVGRTLMTDRVFRIDWSPHGGPNGIVAGCFTDGSIQVWSVDTILENFALDPTKDTADPSLCRIEAHSGPCRTLQFSPTQPHYLASGGQDKELCIWTLQDPREPAAVPALPKATHNGELSDVKWNPKFAHILATSTTSGTVTVWDLKARRTALSFNVSANQAGAANCIAWHPEVSTHIAVARDDVNPVVQLWDLKKAMAPIRELRGHSKGVTGLSWNSEDPSLLLSCGCDGRTICWNPSTGDLLGELPVQDNWIYEVQWCPKASSIIGTASFESLLGVFSGQDIACGGASAIKTVPKWLRRPCGAAFGFGGRFVAPVKGNNNIAVTQTTRGDASGDKNFRQSLIANPPHTQERIELLKSLQMDVIAASEGCIVAGNRQPLLEHLGFVAADIEAEVESVGFPYSKEEEEFEALLVKCVVTGRFAAGVSLCLAASRFDDAFAVAQLGNQSSALTMRVIQQYTGTGRLRFLKYLKAILCDAYDEVATDPALPWREVLALFATYLNHEQLNAKANTLAKELENRGENDGAAAAYVCCANVNGFADLQKSQQPSQRVVQLVTVLEQAVAVQCTSTAFAQCLSAYATFLANAGDFEGALLLSNRAAQLGDIAAAVVADRIQYHVPSAAAVRVGFPFVLSAIPDAQQIECHMLASRQQPVLDKVTQPAVHQQPAAARPLPQPVQSPVVAAPVHQQPQSFAPPHHSAVQPVPPHHNAHYDPQPSVHQQAPVHHPPVSHASHHTSAAPQHPNGVHPQQSHQQPFTAAGHPQQPPAVPPQPPQPAQRQQSPPHEASSFVAAAPSQPHVPPHPVYTQPATVAHQAPTPAPRTGSQPLAPSALSTFNVSSLANPAHQEIARGIVDATMKVTDKRKRDAIEKSSNELFERMRNGLISDPVAELLLAYAKTAGTPAGKENWRKLSDAHYDVVQPFLNIKFL